MSSNVRSRLLGSSDSDSDEIPITGGNSASTNVYHYALNDVDKEFIELQDASVQFVIVLSLFSAIGGLLFGYDTGVVSGAMILLRDNFALTAFWQELIVSITIAMAAISSFIGIFLNDKLGRRKTIMISSILFIAGSLTLGTAHTKEMLLSGRAVVGIAIGCSSMTVPMYIAECAPPQSRGTLVTLNVLFITGGQLIASIIDGFFSHDVANGWRWMLGLAAIPAFIQFAGLLFLPESPRWLMRKNRLTDARKVLSSIRHYTQVENEMDEILKAEEETQYSGRCQIFAMLLHPPTRRALLIGCTLQSFQQILAINTVMYYGASIISMAGVGSHRQTIWLATIPAATNFLFSFLGLYLIEKIGRRKLTIISYTASVLSLLLLSGVFYLMFVHSPMLSSSDFVDDCSNYTLCSHCITNPLCGMCSFNSTLMCLPVMSNDSLHSQYGACGPFNSLAQWTQVSCPSDYSWLAIFALALYIASFAPGMGATPWTINSEIYPLWARGTGNAAAAACNWSFNLLLSMTFLSISQVLNPHGAFLLYAMVSVVGLVLLVAVLPETKGRKLEDIQQLFEKPLCS